MSEAKPLEYWLECINKASSNDNWTIMAASFIGKLALTEGVPADIANGARIMFAAAPEEIIASAANFHRVVASQQKAIHNVAERGISDIESFLEWQANGDSN